MKKTLIFIFVAAVCGLYRMLCVKQDEPQVQNTPLSVHVIAAAPAKVPFAYGTVGTTDALQKIDVRPQISGKLTEILFKEGGLVKKGDLIAKIDDAESKATIVRADAELAANQAKLREAEKNLKRLAQLKKSGFASQKSWETQKSLCAQLRAAVKSGKAQAEIARVNDGYTRITAPISGRIGFKNADAGNVVFTDEIIASIVQTDFMSVVFSVPQTLFPQLENNTRALRIFRLSDSSVPPLPSKSTPNG